MRGHTFHSSTCPSLLRPQVSTARPGQSPAADTADAGEALFVQGSVRASDFHAWFASAPEAVAQLFGAALQEPSHG